jgi:riboflavin biosynthesis pyrimidine reductase
LSTDVEREIAALYGGLPEPKGVVHVVAAARDAGRLRVLKIGPDAPKSDTDFFVLSLARARADAVLTTARILREEPALSLDFAGPWASGLAAYRSELGKQRLTALVLTLGGDLPAAHPLWHDALERLVLTTSSGAAALRARLAERAEVIASDAPSPRAALELLSSRGARAISIEAGPSTAGSLYGPPPCIDELWLSIAELPLMPEQLGGALPEDARLFAGLRLASERVRTEQSGPWRFQRWVRSV